MVNYDLLKEKIRQSGFRHKHIADIMGLSESNLSYKINGKRKILLDDVPAFQRALNLSRKEMLDIFFADNVE